LQQHGKDGDYRHGEEWGHRGQREDQPFVGFDGLTVKGVKGCSPLPYDRLPEGSNSGFSSAIDNLAAGASRSYAVDASYDLGRAGKICLPVLSEDGKKTYWQQGPVPF